MFAFWMPNPVEIGIQRVHALADDPLLLSPTQYTFPIGTVVNMRFAHRSIALDVFLKDRSTAQSLHG